MDRVEAIILLKDNQSRRLGDEEVTHSNADDILCKLLVSLGYKDVVDEWEKIDKWYS